MSACRSVMIVEDNFDIRDSLQQILEIEGFRPIVAKNGREAVDLLTRQGETPCLILLDLMMPMMTGWEFLKVRREDERLSSIPVVVVSAVASSLSESEQLEKGEAGVGYLGKPLELETLLETIRRHCSK